MLRAAVGRVHLVAAGGAGQHRELDAAQTGAGQPEGVPGHTPGENTHTCWHTHTQVLWGCKGLNLKTKSSCSPVKRWGPCWRSSQRYLFISHCTHVILAKQLKCILLVNGSQRAGAERLLRWKRYSNSQETSETLPCASVREADWCLLKACRCRRTMADVCGWISLKIFTFWYLDLRILLAIWMFLLA